MTLLGELTTADASQIARDYCKLANSSVVGADTHAPIVANRET